MKGRGTLLGVAAMAVMSFPFLVRTVRLAFEEINPRLEQVARTLGATPTRVFLTITLPLARVPLPKEKLGAVTLAVPAELREEFSFHSGQYVTVRRMIEGSEQRRAGRCGELYPGGPPVGRDALE